MSAIRNRVLNRQVRLFLVAILGLGCGIGPLSTFTSRAIGAQPAPTTSQSVRRDVGEKIPSEDPSIKNLHSLGLVNGHVNIFRSASPVRDIAISAAATQDSAAALAAAKARMQKLRDLGIRTIISYEHPLQDRNTPGSANSIQVERSLALERAAAAEVGITFLFRPWSNSGRDSMEDMSDEAVAKLLDAEVNEVFKCADNGGVLFHCTAGRDRTGAVAAYIRLKYQHWSIDQAIAEMRRYGHNWVTFSRNGGESSWHEDHLRAIAESLKKE